MPTRDVDVRRFGIRLLGKNQPKIQEAKTGNHHPAAHLGKYKSDQNAEQSNKLADQKSELAHIGAPWSEKQPAYLPSGSKSELS